MPLGPGDRLGPYEIHRRIGRGGMGEVWEASDPRIGRLVAIKTLAPHLADDRQRLRRFEQEVRAAGALNHPNVLSVYDVGEVEGVPYLVTERLEGTTLEARLRDGPLPIRRALEIFRQVAEGLAAAHRRGIVHRDLKPANLFLTDGDHVRILDFGIAKLVGGDGEGAPAMTETGAVLGTLAYLSPEQLHGQPADPRSDLFAFGAIFWEALVGRALFARPNAAGILQAILRDEPPDLADERPGTPREIADLVARCLEKDPAHRFQSAHDLAFTLRTMGSGATGEATDATPPGRRRSPTPSRALRRRAAWLAAPLLLAAGALLALVLRPAPPRPPPSVVHLTLSRNDYAPAASPDGRTVAFVSQRDGRPRVWLKELAGGGETPLTAGPDLFPRFAPDGASLLFVRLEDGRRRLFRQPFPGGEPVALLRDVTDADWSPDGRRLVWTRPLGDDGGGSELGVLDLESGTRRSLAAFPDAFLYQPRWSPDGRHVALVAPGGDELVVVAVADGGVTLLRPPPPYQGRPLSTAVWDGPDHLVYLAAEGPLPGVATTAGSCLRQPIAADADDADDVAADDVQILFRSPNWGQHLDLLPGGRAVFAAGFSRQSLWLESLAGDAARPLTDGGSIDRQPAWSPDGRWLVFSSDRSGNLDLWRLELASGELLRLTDHPAVDWDPTFTADGEHLVWVSGRGDAFQLWTAAADGSGARRLAATPTGVADPAASPDGAWLVASTAGEDGGLWRLASGGDDARRVVAGRAALPRFSPDGSLLAYLGEEADAPAVRVVAWSASRGAPREAVAALPVARPSETDLFLPGRAGWLPAADGRLAVLDRAPSGRPALLAYRPLADPQTPQILLDLAGGEVPESFAVAPDGRTVAVSRLDLHQRLLFVSGLPEP